MNYVINKDTCAIIATYEGSKIIERNKVIHFYHTPKKIINYNCKYYGSSLEGRLEATKEMINVNYKAPIIISESKKIVMFPTTSVREKHCSWINLDYVLNYFNYNKEKQLLKLISSDKISIDISEKTLENQIMRSSRLKLIFLERND
jgi:competence protein ComK